MISIQSQISIIQTIVYFVAAAVPIYLTFIINRYNNRNNQLRNLTIALAAFVIMQGIYHSAVVLGFSVLAKGVLNHSHLVYYFSLELSILLIGRRRENRRSKKYNDTDSK